MNPKNQIDPVVPVSPEKQDAEVLATLGARVLNQRKTEERAVAMLGKSIGYGRLMELAQQEWRRELQDGTGHVGGEFASGPCVALTVVCGCRYEEEVSRCEWCCGSGWLTRHVRELQIQCEALHDLAPGLVDKHGRINTHAVAQRADRFSTIARNTMDTGEVEHSSPADKGVTVCIMDPGEEPTAEQITARAELVLQPGGRYGFDKLSPDLPDLASTEDGLVMKRAILDHLATEQRRVPEPLNIHSSLPEGSSHLLSTMDQEVDAANIEALWPAKAIMLRADAYLSTRDAPLTEKDVPLLCNLEKDVQMTIKQLHDVLAELVLAGGGLRVITDGFDFGTTYRGDYSQVAFEPVTVTNVSAMYAAVANMLGGLLQGKNPHPTPVTHDTLVNIAKYNDCGEDDELTPRRLKIMLGMEDA